MRKNLKKFFFEYFESSSHENPLSLDGPILKVFVVASIEAGIRRVESGDEEESSEVRGFPHKSSL